MEEKKVRTDKAKNIKKVAEALIKNPLKTSREIAEEIGISKSSVNNHIDNLAEVGQKDFRIIKVCDTDFEIVTLGQAIIKERLKDKEEIDKMRTFEIAQTIEKSEKRYMLFKGDATDEKGGLKDTSALESLNNLIG